MKIKPRLLTQAFKAWKKLTAIRLIFIWCTGVLHHVQKPVEAINEIGRILKPGGQAYIFVTGGESLMSRLLYNGICSHYQSNKEFKDFMQKEDIDILEFLHGLIEYSKSTLIEKGGDSGIVKKNISLLENSIRLD